MSRFLRRDPLKRAKKHVEKALRELEDGYPDYASTEYEKAACLFLEEKETDFAVKYFREAAFCSLDAEDHSRGADMKMEAANALLGDSRFDEGGALLSEASDHLFSYLAARNFSTAINLTRKAEKRFSATSVKESMFNFAQLSTQILCEGAAASDRQLGKAISAAKPKPQEEELIKFVAESTKLAQKTEVVIEWAGATHDKISVKTPIEFELRYKCPVPVKVVDSRYALSKSLKFTKEPDIDPRLGKEDSWLLELLPVLSGEGSVGPFSMTLEGESVLVNKFSNAIEFQISRAPSDLKMNLTPERLSCGLGDESVFDVEFVNEGDGPADNIKVTVELSDGLEISLGSSEKTIQFIGPRERMRFQVYVRGVSIGDEMVTIKAVDSRVGEEIVKSSVVRVA
jgi:tetratricopeptide (TPR) repeat protein